MNTATPSTTSTPNMLINCRMFKTLARYEKPESLIKTLLELAEYTETGKEPENPSQLFKDLFAETKDGREKYLQTCERNKKGWETRRANSEANAAADTDSSANDNPNGITIPAASSSAKAEPQQIQPQRKAETAKTEEQKQLEEIIQTAKEFEFPTTKGDITTIARLEKEYGHTETLEAIKTAGQGGQEQRNWRYVKGILENRKNNIAKQTGSGYEERSYSNAELENAAGTSELLKAARAQKNQTEWRPIEGKFY